jgi:DNA-binding transcriptional LysR family regulator
VQLQQLAYFVAVADARNFTRAAATVGIAQPSLSQQIQTLERDLGARLFDRLPGGIELTTAAEELLPLARRILADSDTARRVVRELNDLDRGRVRLGATPSLCTGLLPSMLAGFRDDHPGVALAVTESGSRDLQTLLTEGALDLALIVDPGAQDRGVEDSARLSTVPLFVEELVVISPLDAPPLVEGDHLDISELRDRPLVMFRKGYDLRERTVAACRTAGFEPVFAVEGGEMDAVLAFVAAGLGIAVVPSTVVGDRFRRTPFGGAGLSREVRLARRGGVEPPRAAQELERSVLRYVADARSTSVLPVGTRALLPAPPTG